MSLLFAVTPALPLGKAGKYVAAAYIVVFVVILVYVAIMAVRAQRTQRELDELRRDVEAVKAAQAELDDDPIPATTPVSPRAGALRALGADRVSELLAIGVSHKTAPVEVRERLALSQTRAPEFMRELRAAADVHETVAISTCNRTELYLVVGDPVEAESTRADDARAAGGDPPDRAGLQRSTRTATARPLATCTGSSRAWIR